MIETATGLIAGTYDLLGIIKDTSTGRYYVTLWEDKPLPGNPNLLAVRLKSKFQHTKGADTLQEAVEQAREMRTKLTIDDVNVWTDASRVFERDFASDGPTDVRVIEKWR